MNLTRHPPATVVHYLFHVKPSGDDEKTPMRGHRRLFSAHTRGVF